MYEYRTGDSEGRATDLFAHFLVTIMFDFPPNTQVEDYLRSIKVDTSKFNSIGDPIYFISEQEFLVFLLRFGGEQVA